VQEREDQHTETDDQEIQASAGRGYEDILVGTYITSGRDERKPGIGQKRYQPGSGAKYPLQLAAPSGAIMLLHGNGQCSGQQV